MQYSVDIGSVTAEVKESSLIIRSNSPIRVLSSGVLNGGLKEATAIVNVQVSENCGDDKNDEHWNAEEFLRKHVKKLALSEERTVGLMTAARMQNAAVSHQKAGETKMTVFVTAGTSIAVTAGENRTSIMNRLEPRKFGTINIIALIDGNLTQSCMVDAVKTITEAKTVALRELDIRSRLSGDLASGTMTDSVVVACTGIGQRMRYAGTRTVLGEFLGKGVREATKEAILKQENLRSDRQLTERLEERNISLEEIFRLCSSPRYEVMNNEERELVKTQVQELLSDQEVALLVLAGLRLDEDQESGLFPRKQISKSLEEMVLAKIIQDIFQTYKAQKELETDFAPNYGRAITAVNKKPGPLTKAVLSAIFREATARADQAKG
jgi:iron complex transport system ATP-binding protein